MRGARPRCLGAGSRMRDHPRVCGEHRAAAHLPYRERGSSPRMRGALRREVQTPQARRIIPAYAGSTRPCFRSVAERRDHPRVCGEHCARCRRTLTGWGSSPRMRGALSWHRVQRRVPGIIPAYAGSTGWWAGRKRLRRDHPRVCGEHLRLRNRQYRRRGSSPRMRGALVSHDELMLSAGIIPAYAGSTLAARRDARHRQDHPRVCGEHSAVPRLSFSKRGSSPRMRGAHRRGVVRRLRDGIIPAYAGSTSNTETQSRFK